MYMLIILLEGNFNVNNTFPFYNGMPIVRKAASGGPCAAIPLASSSSWSGPRFARES